MPKRKPISKSLRFEVFKRDHFTCQYCGRKAPDVVLHVDHLKPVADGGGNDIMNLVTSCSECNLGKGKRKLDDATMVQKQRAQAEYLAERREQIEMIRDWHVELAKQEDEEVDAIDKYFQALTGDKRRLTDSYKNGEMRSLVRKHGVNIVYRAIQKGMESYRGDLTRTLEKLPGICACVADPDLSERVRIVNVLGRRCFDFDRQDASMLIKRGWDAGGYDFLEEVEQVFTESARRDWSEAFSILIGIIKRHEDASA